MDKVVHEWKYKWGDGHVTPCGLIEKPGMFHCVEPYLHEIHVMNARPPGHTISDFPPITSELARLAQENAAQAKEYDKLDKALKRIINITSLMLYCEGERDHTMNPQMASDWNKQRSNAHSSLIKALDELTNPG